MAYNQYVCWGEEATWATEVARTIFARPYEDSTLKHEKPQQVQEWLGDRDPSSPFYQAERGVGNIVIPLTYTQSEIFLKHCFGKMTTAGAGPYTHTMDVDNLPFTRSSPAALKGLSVELMLGLPDTNEEALLLTGGRVRSFGSTFRPNEEIKLTADLVGKQVTLGPDTASPTFPDYDGNDIVKFNQIAITIDGGSEDIYGLEWTCNNNLRDDRAIMGSQYIAEPRAQGRREISGTIELDWADNSLYDKFISGASAVILATATGPGNLQMVFRWNNVRFTGETPGLQHGEEQDYSLPFTAYHDATYGAMQCVITNDTAAP